MNQRPFTTLFLLVSADGKISTGDTDAMDVDKDYPEIPGIKEGLDQYYDMERNTDLFSFNSGRVFAKVGINDRTDVPAKTKVNFVVVDNKPHLTGEGVAYLAEMSRNLVIATTNKAHPAVSAREKFENVHVMEYQREVDFGDLFGTLKQDFGAERLTVQSGGTLNTKLVREGLIDRVLLVVAPALVGGGDTSTLMDGRSLHTQEELSQIKALELVQAKPLDSSYVLLEYLVKN
ncbi:MAG: dihydrofolate reductase family protein [Chloroflexi bacterium]|nr:dihydrofolate reductase family protein [Chloroflexota bacterium]